ncbi:tetratricopeptide repeat protein [Erythrobacter tepidarius]|uniref:tetratricopeptide repeat protein n=1 Tax=Erythrobacter tepidarius TaxID=60454 RepID=UPI000A3725B0|nr:tetratricopeptide repeat protein [Erythrobacter tepidarius]
MARIPTTPSSPPAVPAEDDILIREIDEAVRQDDALEFLRNHGPKLLGGIIALIAGLGGYMVWDNYREGQLETQSETLISALDAANQRDFAGASEKVAPLLDDGSAGARTAARMLQAAAALEQGEVDKASGLYQQVAADADAPPALRDLATIRDVAARYDRMKPADVIAKLGPLAKPDNPWFGSAGELVAMAYLESGNRAEAGKLFAQIAKDEEQPDTLRSRARQMAGLLGVDAVVDVKKLLEDEGVSSAGMRAGGTAATAAATASAE